MEYSLYYCFLLIVVFTFAYFNSLHDIENFTPKIREMYRPYVRNARHFGEGFYGKHRNNISNLFRKIGIM